MDSVSVEIPAASEQAKPRPKVEMTENRFPKMLFMSRKSLTKSRSGPPMILEDGLEPEAKRQQFVNNYSQIVDVLLTNC